MKSAGWHLLFLGVAGTLAAQPAEPAPPSRTSARLTQDIRATLPKFVPPPETKPTGTESAPADSDPELLVLPTVTVQEKRVPRIKANDLLSTRELNKKFAREYKKSLTGLDAVLNGFSIPIVSPSLAARGRTADKGRKMGELDHGIENIRLADPKTSSGLKEAVLEMQRVEDWNNRVTGGK